MRMRFATLTNAYYISKAELFGKAPLTLARCLKFWTGGTGHNKIWRFFSYDALMIGKNGLLSSLKKSSCPNKSKQVSEITY